MAKSEEIWTLLPVGEVLRPLESWAAVERAQVVRVILDQVTRVSHGGYYWTKILHQIQVLLLALTAVIGYPPADPGKYASRFPRVQRRQLVVVSTMSLFRFLQIQYCSGFKPL